MKHLFVPYQIALALKEIGFDEECIYHYKHSGDGKKRSSIPTFEMKEHFGANHNQIITRVSAPLYDQVIDWFIEKYDISFYPSPNWDGANWDLTTHPTRKEGRDLASQMEEEIFGVDEFENLKSRKEALDAGILKAIKLIKQKK